MKNAVLTAMRDRDLNEVDFDSKSNSFKSTGDTLSMSDLNKDGFTVMSTRFSPYGNTIMIKDDKGKVHRYEMPVGINQTNESNRDRIVSQYILPLQQYMMNIIKDENGNYRELSEQDQEELALLRQQYNLALQEAYSYHSQIGLQNKTAEQSFDNYSF